MDHLDSYLATAACNPTCSVALKAALAMGKKTLNRYYNKTNHSEPYIIAMGWFLSSLQYHKLFLMYYFDFFSSPSSAQVAILSGHQLGAGMG